MLSALVGGVFCVLADLMQKSDASAVEHLGRKLGETFSLVQGATLLATLTVLVLAVAVPLIFESSTKTSAFYLGASVLAILMTMTPYEPPSGFQTLPNSVEVLLSIETADGKPANGARVTLRDAGGTQIISRSRLPKSDLRFFQDEGVYRLTVELAGYEVATERLVLKEGQPPQTMKVKLQPSDKPRILQRILQ